MICADRIEEKDPDADLDYGWKWTKWLEPGDAIAASTWAVTPAGPTLHLSTFDGTSTTIWMSGGTLGVTYLLTNHITTTQNRIDDRSFYVVIKNR